MVKNSSETPFECSPKLLDLLVCPITKTNLKFDKKNNELISEAAKLAFPVRDGIPVMLIEEARHIKN